VHNIAIDSKGTAEVGFGRRVQNFKRPN